jgi:hypothetical protein
MLEDIRISSALVFDTMRTYCFAADCAVFFSDCMRGESWWYAATKKKMTKKTPAATPTNLGAERIGGILRRKRVWRKKNVVFEERVWEGGAFVL